MLRFVPTRTAAIVIALISTWILSTAVAQILPLTFTAVMMGDSLTPPVATEGQATAIAVLVGEQLIVTGTYQDLGSTITAANVRSAPPGENGPVLRLSADQGSVAGESRDRARLTVYGQRNGTFSGVFTLTAEQVGELEAGHYYVQLYTRMNFGGELRGQLASETIVAPTAADLVGIWKSSRQGRVWEFRNDGTFREAVSPESLEENFNYRGDYTIDANLVTIFDMEGCPDPAANPYCFDPPPDCSEIFLFEFRVDDTLRFGHVGTTCQATDDPLETAAPALRTGLFGVREWETFIRTSP